MPSALIADDEPHLAAHLKLRLAQLWPELDVIGLAANGLEAQEWLAARQPDVAFLDIKMPGLSGLQVAQAARCHCVFVTAYNEYAVQAFEQQALDYLLKPVTDERLAKTVARLKASLAHAPAPDLGNLLGQLQQALRAPAAPIERLSWIRAGVGQEIRLIAVDDVCYFQASDKYTAVVTADGEYLIRTPLKELHEQLDAQQFWQIHRSTLVNARQIRDVARDFTGKLTLRLKGRDDRLTVSRAYAHLFRQM
ncbi:LytTR family DNA-binding domain-containing protein [Chitinivorax sp. PXF-14]|uniref:LytR/AlgR family response regulator transcription factor n=1 Tax=Chitinivorax sp. PXF-14 TaxID=3230488 RepID=UPI0034674CB6